MTSSFVVQLDLALKDKLQDGLIDQGFKLDHPPYTFFQAKKQGISCTLYTSGKLVVQGKGMEEFIKYYLEPEILHVFSYGYEGEKQDKTPRIGVDESGKGDFFGPLCIAGVYAGEEEIKALLSFNVKDSKKLKDSSIVTIAQKIRSTCSHHVVRINPKKYNELYEKFNNLNLLLGWGHATVIDALSDKTGCTRALIDQFAAEYVVENALKRKHKQILLTQKTKGEEDVVVAAASILARAAFIEGLELLEKEFQLSLPKGASQATINSGKQLVKTFGKEVLERVGKLHFKTRQQILEIF